MSFQINAVVRTTGFVGELVEKKKSASDPKSFDSKSIIFKVASNRRYTSTKTVNGKTVSEKVADYMLCRASGVVAQLVNDYCKDVKSSEIVNGVSRDTYISRHLELEGHLETYKKDRSNKVDKDITIEGKTYKVEFETKAISVLETIFVVDHIEFLDPNPNPKTVGKDKAKAVVSGDVKITEVLPQGNVEGEISKETMEDLSAPAQDEFDAEGNLVVPVPF